MLKQLNDLGNKKGEQGVFPLLSSKSIYVRPKILNFNRKRTWFFYVLSTTDLLVISQCCQEFSIFRQFNEWLKNTLGE